MERVTCGFCGDGGHPTNDCHLKSGTLRRESIRGAGGARPDARRGGRPLVATVDVRKIKSRVQTQLHRIRLESDLLDIYGRDGWQGGSREKLRPSTELERARTQVCNSMQAIRGAMEQLHKISQEGAIDDDEFDGDGQIKHEAIFCANCKSSEVFPENDIILCDGDCNRAFHQECLDPPLQTCNIPPGDEGWLCPACDCKIDCIKAINAATEANLPLQGCKWEDVFAEVLEEAQGSALVVAGLDNDWPSDDSDDEDYAPTWNAQAGAERSGEAEAPNGVESREAGRGENGEWREDVLLDGPRVDGGEDSGSGGDGSDMDIEECERPNTGRLLRSQGLGAEGRLEELPADWVEKVEEVQAEESLVLEGKRRRTPVDYRKLNEELFGAVEEADEGGEDWDPRKRRRQRGLEGARRQGAAREDPLTCSLQEGARRRVCRRVAGQLETNHGKQAEDAQGESGGVDGAPSENALFRDPATWPT